MVHVRVQQRDPDLAGDLGWQDAPAAVASVNASPDTPTPPNPDLALWTGTATFTEDPTPGRFRLLIEEFEQFTGDAPRGSAARRLVYAEIFALDYFAHAPA